MIKSVRAKFTKGALKPLERLELEEGQEVFLHFDDEPKLSEEERMKRFRSAAGGWKHNEEYWKDMKGTLHDYRHPERGIRSNSWHIHKY